MTAPIIPFTRAPSIKVPVVVSQGGLVAADNTLIIIGRMGASGSTVSAGAITTINNYGDPVAALAECNTYFGANSEAGAMVVAAISGVLYSSLSVKLFPPIKVIPMANAATSSGLAAVLGNLLAFPAPYVVIPFDGNDSVAMVSFQNYLTAINGNDRGDNGQFGSFGFMATQGDTSPSSAIGIAAASQMINIPWLRDLAATTSNTSAQIASAYGAVCASLTVPYLSLDNISIGGLVAPANSADWHTSGDTGTVALGLTAGLSPLLVSGSKIVISRSITTVRSVSSIADAAYYDIQDWQVLYYLRKNVYNIAAQPRYKQAKASITKLQSLKSEILQLCKAMEGLEMLQYVDLLAAQFTVDRSPTNRHAAVYRIPVNVIPGFHGKGVELDAGTQFDILVS